MIANGLCFLGVLLSVALGVAVAWIVYLTGTANSIVHLIGMRGGQAATVNCAALVTISLVAPIFGYTFDRSEKRGLFASYWAESVKAYRSLEKREGPESFDPVGRVAIFVFPLVLFPWLSAIGGICFAVIYAFWHPLCNVTAAALVGVWGISLAYGLFTRDRRHVSPEAAEAIRKEAEAFREAFKRSQDEDVRQMREKAIDRARRIPPPGGEKTDTAKASPMIRASVKSKGVVDTAEPVAQAARFRDCRWDGFRAMWIPLLLFALSFAGIIVAACVDPQLERNMVFPIIVFVLFAASIIWMAIIIFVRKLYRKVTEPCPHCTCMVIYDRREKGLTVICPDCGEPWMAGEKKARWDIDSDE